MKRLGVFLLPPGWDTSSSQDTILGNETKRNGNYHDTFDWKPPLPTANLIRLCTIYKWVVIYLETTGNYSFQLEQRFSNIEMFSKLLFCKNRVNFEEERTYHGNFPSR